MLIAKEVKDSKVVEKTREDRIKETISNTDYMEWISKFTDRKSVV